MNLSHAKWLRSLLCTLFLGLLAPMALAQTITVKGVVTDATHNEPVIGATVKLVEDASKGMLTNLDGQFTLTAVPTNGHIRVSYIGYKTIEVPINGQSSIQIVLQEDTELLDEVVVTALGIKRSEKALSYNVQKLDNEQLTTVKDANFINSLSGKVAGVNIQKSASGVGGGVRVVMRGNKSIAGDNNVLYVIDGIPVGNKADRGGDGSGFASTASSEGIGSLNPEDIESISVLTGPSAAALYGAAAANGVILINTKKGEEGSLKVNFSTSFEGSQAYILPRFQNRYGNNEGSYLSWGAKLDTPSNYEPRDFFETGLMFNNALSLSVGSKVNQTYVSVAAINSKGIIPNNKYHRYNAMVRNTSSLFEDKLHLDFSASYSREYYNNMIAYGTYFNPIVGAYLYPRGEDFNREKEFERFNPETGIYEQSWSVGDFGMNTQNPYWEAYRTLRPVASDRYTFYGQVGYDFTDWLNLSGRVRLDNTYTESEDKRYASTISTHAKPNGRYSYKQSTFRQKYMDLMLNINKSFLDDFNIMVNAGSSFEEYDTKSRGYGGDLLSFPNKFTYTNVNPTTAVPSEDGGNDRTRNVAVFGSAELGWKSIAYLTLTGRGDQNSRLIGTNDSWIFYPSVGLSLVFTELFSENTKAKMNPILSFGKIRGSYTEVGSPIPFAGLTPGSVTRDIKGGAAAPYEYYPLPDLRAERTRSYELGLDTRWAGGLINLGVTLYHSNTYNQLLKKKLPGGAGYNYMFVQAGNVQNRGIELTLSLQKEFKNGFGFNSVITATHNKNRIVELANVVKNPITGSPLDFSFIDQGRFRLVKDGEIGMMYATKQLKRDKDGYMNYTKGQAPVAEDVEPYQLGSVNPDWNLGYAQGFNYKGIGLNFLFNARIGGVVISKTQAMLDKYGVSEESALARDNGGIKMADFTMDPKDYYTAVSELDAYYVYSATNVRLQELRLSYSLPSKWLGNTLRSASFAVYGTNLLMIYNKAPFDPELTAGTGTFGQGYDNFLMPSQRGFGLSINLGF